MVTTETLLESPIDILHFFEIFVLLFSRALFFFFSKTQTKFVVMVFGLSASAKFVAQSYNECTIALLTN